MAFTRPLVKYNLYHKTTLNQLLPDWADVESPIGQELNDAITLFASHVLKFPLYELPTMPNVDGATAKDMTAMFIVWRDLKNQLTTDEQRYFWGLDLGARALINQLPPQEYIKQLRYGHSCDLTSDGFVKSTKTAIIENNKDGLYGQAVNSMRQSLDLLAMQIHDDKYNDSLNNAYMNLHYQIHNLTKQVALY